jgi:microcystin-dependent protein
MLGSSWTAQGRRRLPPTPARPGHRLWRWVTVAAVVIGLASVGLGAAALHRSSKVDSSQGEVNSRVEALEAAGVVGGSILPTGSIMVWSSASSVVPQGYVLCDGRSLLVSQHRSLFAAIGTVFGGDGVTTFRVPNLLDRTVVGAGGARTVGATGGSETVTLRLEQMPNHTHVNGAFDILLRMDGTGTTTDSNSLHGPNMAEPNLLDSRPMLSQGGNQPHDNMPPYVALSFIMKL